MDETFHGSFPGGPRKSVPARARHAPPRLSRVEEIEERAARGHVRRMQWNRLRRAIYGFSACLLIAGASRCRARPPKPPDR